MNQNVEYLSCMIISARAIEIFNISQNGAQRPQNGANFKIRKMNQNEIFLSCMMMISIGSMGIFVISPNEPCIPDMGTISKSQ